MKKVCFIIPVLGNDGAERVAFHLLNNLNLEKYQLTLLLTNCGGNYLKDLNVNVQLIELKEKRVRYTLLKLYKSLNQLQPDICLIFSSEIATVIGLFIAPFFKKTKFIVREINIQSILMTSLLRKILLKLSYKCMYKVISQSKDMTFDLITWTKVNQNKIIEINNPIDMNIIDKKIEDKDINIEFKNDYKILLCIGRLEKQKGFDLIINVMKKLKKKKIHLYIIGEGSERINLEKQIKNLKLENNVFLLGRKSNPYIYMNKADLFILSSRFEGFPNVLLEAGACGLYSICNICPGGVNEIIQNNINGNIVNFKDINATSKLILKKLECNFNEKIIRESILTRYDIKIITEKYEQLFNGI